jgi:hypothetical protein
VSLDAIEYSLDSHADESRKEGKTRAREKRMRL